MFSGYLREHVSTGGGEVQKSWRAGVPIPYREVRVNPIVSRTAALATANSPKSTRHDDRRHPSSSATSDTGSRIPSDLRACGVVGGASAVTSVDRTTPRASSFSERTGRVRTTLRSSPAARIGDGIRTALPTSGPLAQPECPAPGSDGGEENPVEEKSDIAGFPVDLGRSVPIHGPICRSPRR